MITPIKPGDPISAAWLNEIASRVCDRISVTGGRVSRIGQNVLLNIDSGGGGGTGEILVIVTEVEGTAPPYLYSAHAAEYDDGSWVETDGGATYTANIVNTAEAMGKGGKLLVGQPIYIRRLTSELYACTCPNYYGTYG
jgi:phage baseplate assembly protein gpV